MDLELLQVLVLHVLATVPTAVSAAGVVYTPVPSDRAAAGAGDAGCPLAKVCPIPRPKPPRQVATPEVAVWQLAASALPSAEVGGRLLEDALHGKG